MITETNNYLINLYECKKKLILVGFSLGTVGVWNIVKTIKIDRLVLISPSPVYNEVLFKDNLIKQRKSISEIEKRCDTIIYYGSKEVKEIKETAKVLAKKIGIQAIELKGYGHTKNLVKKVLKIEGLA